MSAFQLLVSLAFLGVIGFAMMQMKSYTSRPTMIGGAGGASQLVEFNRLVGSLHLAVNDASSCTAALQGKDAENDAEVEIEFAGLLLGKGKRFGGLQIQKISLRNVRETTPPTPTVRMADLVVTAQAAADAPKTPTDPKVHEFSLAMNLELENGGKKIKECYGQASPTAVCQQLGGTYNAAAFPQCRLPGMGGGTTSAAGDPAATSRAPASRGHGVRLCMQAAGEKCRGPGAIPRCSACMNPNDAAGSTPWSGDLELGVPDCLRFKLEAC